MTFPASDCKILVVDFVNHFGRTFQIAKAVSKVFCRAYQFCFRIALPFLPYREPEICRSIEQIPEILKEKRISSVLLVTDPGLRKGLLKVLRKIPLLIAIPTTGGTGGETTGTAVITDRDTRTLALDAARLVFANIEAAYQDGSNRAAREANPLYPVPILMDARELEQFYYNAADWRNEHAD